MMKMCGSENAESSEKNQLESAGWGIFLIGIGFLFWQDISIFPWILAVIAFAALPKNLANKSIGAALQEMIWLIGLAILFDTGQIFPGILILAGLSTIAGALAKPQIFDEKRKRDQMFDDEKPKRGLPV